MRLSALPPKRENFLCSCTQLGLILLVGATSGRRTVVGDQLRSVDNTFTSLSIFIPSSRPSWAFILFCNFFFFFPRPLKAILAVSLSHPRVLEWYEIPRKVLQVTDSYFFGLIVSHEDPIPGILTWFLLVCPVKDSCTSWWALSFLTCQAVLS